MRSAVTLHKRKFGYSYTDRQRSDSTHVVISLTGLYAPTSSLSLLVAPRHLDLSRMLGTTRWQARTFAHRNTKTAWNFLLCS